MNGISNFFPRLKPKQKLLEEQERLRKDKIAEILSLGISGEDTSKEFEELEQIDKKLEEIKKYEGLSSIVDYLYAEYPMTQASNSVSYITPVYSSKIEGGLI